MDSPMYQNGQVLQLWLPDGGTAVCTVSGFDEETGKHSLVRHAPWSDELAPARAVTEDIVHVDLSQTDHRTEAMPIPTWKSLQIYDACNRALAVEGDDDEDASHSGGGGGGGGDKASSTYREARSRAFVLPAKARPARKAVWEKKIEPGAFWVGDTGSVSVPLPLKDLKELQKSVLPTDIKETRKCTVACFTTEEAAKNVLHNAGLEDYVAWGCLCWDEITMAYNVTIDGEAGPRFIRVSQDRLRPKFEVQTVSGTFKAKYRDSAKDGTSVDGIARLIFRFMDASSSAPTSRVMVVVKNPPGLPALKASTFIRAVGTLEARHNMKGACLEGQIVHQHPGGVCFDFLSDDAVREAEKAAEEAAAAAMAETKALDDSENKPEDVTLPRLGGVLSDGDDEVAAKLKVTTALPRATEERVTMDRLQYRWDIGERVMSRANGGRDKYFPGEIAAVRGGLYDVNLDFADYHDEIYNESGGTMRVVFDGRVDIAELKIPRGAWPEEAIIEVTSAPIMRASWDSMACNWSSFTTPITLVPLKESSRGTRTNSADSDDDARSTRSRGSSRGRSRSSSRTSKAADPKRNIVQALEKALQAVVELDSLVFCYRAGQRVYVNDLDDPSAAFCGTIEKFLEKKGMYRIRVDNDSTKAGRSCLKDLVAANHRPVEEFMYAKGVPLTVFWPPFGWVAATVSSDGPDKELRQHKVKLDGMDEDTLMHLNDVNHYVRYGSSQDEGDSWIVERQRYLTTMRRDFLVRDSLTRKDVDVRALRFCLQVDATKRMGVELDEESVTDGTVDMASVARDSMESTGFPDGNGRRVKGCFSSHPILIRGPPGSGKSWSLSLWANLIAARCMDAEEMGGAEDSPEQVPGSTEGWLPLVIRVVDLARIMRAGLLKVGPSLLRSYIDLKFRDDVRRKQLLLDAVASKRLLLGIDGVNDVADLTNVIMNWISKDLLAMRIRCVITSSVPSPSSPSVDDSSTWRVLTLLPPERDDQLQVLQQQMDVGLCNPIFEYLAAFQSNDGAASTLLESIASETEDQILSTADSNFPEAAAFVQNTVINDPFLLRLFLGLVPRPDDEEMHELPIILPENRTQLYAQALETAIYHAAEAGEENAIIAAAKAAAEEAALEAAEAKAKAKAAEVQVAEEIAAKEAAAGAGAGADADADVNVDSDADTGLDAAAESEARETSMEASPMDNQDDMSVAASIEEGSVEGSIATLSHRKEIAFMRALLERIAFQTHTAGQSSFSFQLVDSIFNVAGRKKATVRKTRAMFLDLSTREKLPLLDVNVDCGADGSRPEEASYRFKDISYQAYLCARVVYTGLRDDPSSVGGVWPLNASLVLSSDWYDEMLRMIREMPDAPSLLFPDGSFSSRTLAGTRCLDRLVLLGEGFVNRLDFHGGSSLRGPLSGKVISFFSAIRASYGVGALQLGGCGPLCFASDLSDIASLTTMDLSGIPTFQGPIDPLAACTSLTKLNLSDSTVHGSFDVLARITSLTWLSIRNCKNIDCTRALEEKHLNLRGYSPLCNLKNLHYIDMSETNVSGTLTTEEIALISRLRRDYGQDAVQMRFCGKMVVTPDWRISKLHEINLGGILTLEGTLSPFELCAKRLMHLNLCDCGGSFSEVHRRYEGGVTGSLAPLERLSVLQSLNLRYCYGIEGEITPGIVSLISRIRCQYGRDAVDLRNCGRFTLSPDMSAIKEIKEVDLSNIQSLAGELHCFEVCKNLEALHLVGCWRIKDAIDNLRMSLAKMPWEDKDDEGEEAGKRRNTSLIINGPDERADRRAAALRYARQVEEEEKRELEKRNQGEDEEQSELRSA